MVLVFLLSPVLILAQPKGFCERLSDFSSRVDQRIISRDAKLGEKRDEIAGRIEERRSERDGRLEEKRGKWDENRAEHFAKLEEKAQTDEQKQAVLVFVKAIEEAIKARRLAIDKAIEDFRRAVEEAKAARKTAVDGAVSNYKNAVKTAFEKAKTDCGQEGVDTETIRENLRIDLKTARENFIKERQEIEKLKTQMEGLIIAKREAIKKAIDEFKTALDQAKEDLKAAFPGEGNSK